MPFALVEPSFDDVVDMDVPQGYELGPPGEPTDDEVQRRWAAGDAQALAWAYRRWGAQLYGMAVRALGPGPDAEDVVRHSFVSAWTGRHRLRLDDAPLPVRLTDTCRHRVADTLANRGRDHRSAT